MPSVRFVSRPLPAKAVIVEGPCYEQKQETIRNWPGPFGDFIRAVYEVIIALV